MRRMLSAMAWAWAVLAAVGPSGAGEPGPGEAREAASRGMRLVRKAAESYTQHRQCFSCHHQTLPMMTVVAAGADADDALIRDQAEFTHASFLERVEPMRQGKGVGGSSMTVGYGLWALALADREPDEVTDAMVAYLLKNQRPDGQWRSHQGRPPLEGSHVMCTVLAAGGLDRYATGARREEADGATARAKAWLASAPAIGQEDRVARLWGLHRLRAEPEQVRQARADVLAAQRDDGGWAQEDDMESDAYATGQTLRLLRATGLGPDDPAFRRGLAFLLRTQHDDGSWRVETRGKPVQVFFDNGDPHGKHQFLSISATCWAVAALAGADEP